MGFNYGGKIDSKKALGERLKFYKRERERNR